MLWKLWAAVGAIVIGLFVPTLSGGGLPQVAVPIVLGAVLLGLVVTCFAMLSGRGGDLQTKSVGATTPGHHSPASDHVMLNEIGRLIGKREIAWLGKESFADSWRSDHCSRLRDVALLDVGHHSISDPELRRSVSHLRDAAGTFVHLHDRNTIADPILRDDTWRTIGRIGADGTPEDLDEEDRLALQGKLRAAADEVCRGIDDVRLRAGTQANAPSLRPPGRPGAWR